MSGNSRRSERAKSLAQFEPERYRLNDAAIDYGIEEAKRIKDWPALEGAVDAKIEEQHKFVAWWRAAVRRPGGDRQSFADFLKKHGRPTDLKAALRQSIEGTGERAPAPLVRRGSGRRSADNDNDR